MSVVTIDYETTYDKDYSLSKMSEVEYILDPRFQVIMCAVKIGRGPTETFVGHDNVATRLGQIDWGKSAVLAHNTRFDGAILGWVFGHYPKLYLDTLSMARATTHWQIGRSALKNVSEYLGLPPKGDEVVRAMGKRLEDFPDTELAQYRRYCARDTDNCKSIWDRLSPLFGAGELSLIDQVLRMFIQPQVLLDTSVLKQHLLEVQAASARIMQSVAAVADKSVFSSNLKFAALLRANGVEVPLKISPVTQELIPAVAKGDRAFKELCQDESQPLEVQALLAARLSVKSTIEETRTANLLRTAELRWPPGGRYDGGRGWAPVPLKYSGARTHRLSGDGGTNWQNFQRGSKIRAAIMAPAGYRIVHRDASQIEARITAWLAQEYNLLTAFREGRDVYSEFASQIYGRKITRDDKLERFVGKTSILGLGYGCGGEKFRHMLFIGNGGVSLNVTEDFAQSIVYKYRDTYPQIHALWGTVDFLLASLIINRSRKAGRSRSQSSRLLDGLPIKRGHESLWLPNGLCIAYPGIRWYTDQQSGRTEMNYDDPYGGQRKIYGAKGVENISQGLARIVVTDTAVRVRERTGLHPFLSTHDSLDYVVPERSAELMDRYLAREFARVPTWATGLPLASEGGWGRNLLEAERGVNQ